MNCSTKSKRKLFHLISELEKDRETCFVNPKSDFTRKRKLSFKTMIKIFLSMGGESLKQEIHNYFGLSVSASDSAFNQQRAKIRYQAFEALFYSYTATIAARKKYKGYRLLACDGSSLWTPIDSNDKKYKCLGEMGHCGGFLHLNALYDLLNNFYTDIEIEPEGTHNEKSALTQMAMSSSVKNKVIYIADRGYESYNLMAHINHLNRFYVIRVKDNHNGGFARIFPKPDNDEYDVEYTRKFTRKMSKEYTKRKGEYVIIRHSYDMDFFTPEHDMYKMTFRIIRFKLPNGQYESIATNLPSNEFTWQEIKEIYNLRWGIESSFRSLKYSVELNQFHGKREEYVLQETFARLIMFNFCQSIVEPITYNSTNKKHIYKPDFKNAVHILKMYLRKTKTPPGLVDELIKKDPIPIRPERSYPRKKYAKAPPFARY